MVKEQRTGVEKVTVAEAEAGRRLDNFLSSRLKDIPKSRVYQMLRRGEVRVNGSRARQDYRLETDDIVRIPPLRLTGAGPPAVPPATAERLLESIVFEDDQLLVLNKPAGLAVHAGSGVSYGVIEILRASRGDNARLDLVHRLDRDTSGCLLLAKDMAMLRSLHEQLRAGLVRKRYVALLQGRMASRELAVDAPLTRTADRGSKADRRVVVDAGGKVSATRLQRRRLFREATLADVDLLTGRTHQIRVHAADVGHPLAGDTKYGDKAFNQKLRAFGLRRLFLHAAGLELTESDRRFEVPLPDELQAVLGRLEG